MSDEDRLADLLVAWEDAAARGETPTPEEHCRDHPDLLGTFRDVLARLTPVNAVLKGGDLDPLSPDQFVAGDLGRYRPLGFHARGGLGVVFAAEDRELGRTVALKCLQPLAALDPDARRRFLAEAEVTTRLEHPGVVPMYGLVEDARGTPYYAMRFVRGATLAGEIARHHEAPAADPAAREVEFRRLLQHFVAVSKTVAYAHSRGVIHRDLKPDNIMIGPYGEVLLLDWGLAKVVGRPDPDATIDHGAEGPLREPDAVAGTRHGRAKGTPAFMPPEQARGEWDRVGPASDVFGLGATLYMVLTGRRPHEGRTVAEVVERARAGRVAPPRSVNPTVPRALDAVCRRALAAEPGDRYASGLELAQDVERWLAGEPVTAWREPLPVRARRWARRNRTLVAAAAASVLVAAVALAAAGVRLDRANRQLDGANRELGKRNDDLAAALNNEREARTLADDRREKTRILLRDAVAFTLWGPGAMTKDPATQRAQLFFLAAQYEAAIGLDDAARTADDLAFTKLIRIYGKSGPVADGDGRRDFDAVIAELTGLVAKDPENDWLALWLAVARGTNGAGFAQEGDKAAARREMVAARELLARLAGRGRVEVPLLLGDLTHELCRLAEATPGASVPELLGWIDDALNALGNGPPPGPLAAALGDNWRLVRAQLMMKRVWFQYDRGRLPGADLAFRALAADLSAERNAVRGPTIATQIAIIESLAWRVIGARSLDADKGLDGLARSESILNDRLGYGADDKEFRTALGHAQVGYLFFATQRVETGGSKEKPLKYATVAAIAERCLTILNDRAHSRDREPFFRELFPKYPDEGVLRAEWEGVLKKATGTAPGKTGPPPAAPKPRG